MSAPFPSLVIRPDSFIPQGSFAEAQAEFLSPDPTVVAELDALLAAKSIGVVAHFYMDPQLQGVLSACRWPHVFISDSLQMADAATRMVEAGCRSVIVLGVDFMSENARAMLDAAGHADVPVYRVAAEPIGCSLAASAEALAYGAWLAKAARTPRSLHVVYINTSLRTKGKAHSIVPTITCTSSNVVNTILTAYAQVPDAHVWYGPDTYMGRNLQRLLSTLADLGDEAVRAVHPAHDASTVRAALERFHFFEQGICVVHHLFGEEVARRVREGYADAFVTAHLEVPGEMFELALDAQRHGRGVVGSTSNILGFITQKTKDAVAGGGQKRLRFILGTEAGMITSIVNAVRALLREHRDAGVDVEIIFPVASEAIAQAPESELAIVPGVAAGEGCSVAGGCATCPYMKMNSLDALLDVVRKIGVTDDDLAPYEPQKYLELIAGRTAADIGGEPILHMRAFQKTGRLPQALADDIAGRAAGGAARGSAAE
ncbi:MAG: quinolinate synthase NadA [Sandaracinaceae bacterium]|nr:quinolinate synthase NadA [Sandaracinaceae bacterium]